MKIIKLQESYSESDSRSDEIASLMSSLRSDIDGLIEKKLTNGKNLWNMNIVPRKGSKCIIPLNLKSNDPYLIYATVMLPRGLKEAYLHGTIDICRIYPPHKFLIFKMCAGASCMNIGGYINDVNRK